MAQKIDEDDVGFLDLPPEIRNVVYGFALTIPEGIWVIRLKRHPYPIVRATEDSRRPDLAVPLLRTCHAINNEAASILYGSNPFHISQRYGPTLEFFQNIGSNIRHLRKVRFHDMPLNTLTDACRRLKQCQQLQSVGFGGIVLWRRAVESVAKSIGPFVRDLHKKRKGTDKKGALEVVRYEEYRGRGGELGEHWRQILALVEKTLK